MKSLSISPYIVEHLPAPVSTSATVSGRQMFYDRNHIFYAILQFVVNQSPSSDKFYCFYLQTLSEKILNYVRREEKNVCLHYFDKIEAVTAAHHYKDKVTEEGMKSLYFPTMAYYYYTLGKDNEKALGLMFETLKCVDTLIEAGFDDGMYMKIEQYINTYRVYHNMQQWDNAYKFIYEVIAYLLGNEVPDFQIPFQNVMSSRKQLYDIYNLFFNGVIFKCLNNYPSNNFFEQPLLLQLVNDILELENPLADTFLVDALQAMQYILTQQYAKALEKIGNQNIFHAEIPSSIRHFLLAFMLEQQGGVDVLDTTLATKVAAYQKNVLRLSPLQIAKSQESVTLTA